MKVKEKEEDRRSGGKTISKIGQEWTLPAQNRTVEIGQDGLGIVATSPVVPRRPSKVMR